jgi:hypothetical protein
MKSLKKIFARSGVASLSILLSLSALLPAAAPPADAHGGNRGRVQVRAGGECRPSVVRVRRTGGYRPVRVVVVTGGQCCNNFQEGYNDGLYDGSHRRRYRPQYWEAEYVQGYNEGYNQGEMQVGC